MYLGLKMVIINKENLEDELYNLFKDIDWEFIGANLNSALKKAKRKHKDDLEKIIADVIDSATSTWGSCYDRWEKEIIKSGENYSVSLAVMSR